MLLSQAIDGFILSKTADGISHNTARIYRAALAKLVMYLGDVDVASITPDDIRQWFIWLRDGYATPPGHVRSAAPLSIASVQQIWRALKSFYTWASAEFQIPRADLVHMPKGESPIIVPLAQEEVKAILKAAEYTTIKTTDRKPYTQHRPSYRRNVALILFLLDTGLRIGEVVRLTVGDLDTETGILIVAPFGTGRKTKARQAYLGKAARRALWRYLAKRAEDLKEALHDDAPLFATERERAFTQQSLGRLVRNLGDRAGVPSCHAHKFRHTFAIEYLRNGGDVFTLKQLLGHRSLAMVQRYLALAQSDVQAAHRRASPADRWRL